MHACDIWGDEAEAAEVAEVAEVREASKPEVTQAADELDSDYAVFDIETGPLPGPVLMDLAPEFVAPPHPGEFDPRAVKLGNLKDKAKIAEKLQAAGSAHAAAVASYEQDCQAARDKHFSDFVARAALDATTGRVVAIGIAVGDSDLRIIDASDNEENGLREWWSVASFCLSRKRPMIGFNILAFDLPFLVRRSWLLGVPIPSGVRVGRYWSELFVDLMVQWAFHGREMVSLNTLAKAFGVGAKVKEVGGIEISGADFHRVYRENRPVAEAYLRADLELPAKIARGMGLI